MADKSINDLTLAEDIYPNDYFLLQQNGTAKKLAGNTLTQFVTRDVVDINVETIPYDGTPQSTYDPDTHTLDMQVQRGPGIQSIEKTSSEGVTDTYTVTTQDGEVAGTFTVTNGAGRVNSVMGITPIAGDIQADSLLRKIYPVGCIFLTTDQRSPNAILGVSWSWLQIEGKFLYAGGTGETPGSTGGSTTHTLTVSEMPTHSHECFKNSVEGYSTDAYWPLGGSEQAYALYGVSQSTALKVTTKDSGGGQPFSIMPPYFTVRAWIRQQ